MSIQELSEQILRSSEKLDELDKAKKALKQERISLIKSFVGELDRQIVEKLSSEGKVQEYEVDGVKWYLVAMKDLGDIKPFTYRGKVERSIRFDTLDVSVSLSYSDCPDRLFAPVKLIDDFGAFKIKKLEYPYSYDEDAMMLTDCRGHRIHTSHSYESYRSSPHWYIGGYRTLDRVEDSIRAYVDELCRKQKEECDFQKREEDRRKKY